LVGQHLGTLEIGKEGLSIWGRQVVMYQKETAGGNFLSQYLLRL
jgi:hypothetical protein